MTRPRGALSISGNASIKLTGGVYVDSRSRSAVRATGHAGITASVIHVHGGVSQTGSVKYNPAPVTRAAVMPDPFSGLPEPSTSGIKNHGTLILGGNSKATINPGIYRQITVSGDASLTLKAGMYIIEGGGFATKGNASVTGTGVTIFNAGSNFPATGGRYGQITLESSGRFMLSPPTRGPYAGLVFIQPDYNTRALSFVGSAVAGARGMIYAPSAHLGVRSKHPLGAAAVVDTLTVSSTAINGSAMIFRSNRGGGRRTATAVAKLPAGPMMHWNRFQ